MTTGILAYDSARPILIPKTAPAVFPYIDGHFKWDHTEFPHASYRYITVTGNPVADICDYEEGCVFNPSKLRIWAAARHAAGHDITVYTDRENFDTVESALSEFQWHLFLSTLDNTVPRSYKGKPCRAVQFTDRKSEYDVSRVYDYGWLNRP